MPEYRSAADRPVLRYLVGKVGLDVYRLECGTKGREPAWKIIVPLRGQSVGYVHPEPDGPLPEAHCPEQGRRKSGIDVTGVAPASAVLAKGAFHYDRTCADAERFARELGGGRRVPEDRR